MKITTRQVLQWDKEIQDYVLVEEESYEYEGPVALCLGGGGGGGSQTQTTRTEPFDLQKRQIEPLFTSARNLFETRKRNPVPFFPSQQVASFSPATEDALQGQAGFARNRLPAQLAEARRAQSELLQSPDPANDPTVQRFAQAAINPLFRQFNEQILPGINSQAVSQGAFGSTRAQLLKQQLAGDLFSRAGDVRAGIFNNAFSEQLRAQQNALGLAPQTAALQNLPNELLSEVGAARENLRQQQINAAREKFEFNQNRQLANLQNFSNIINQFGGTSSTSRTQLPQRSRLSGALGGAATGASIGSVIPGIGTAVGAGVGGLAGLVGLI